MKTWFTKDFMKASAVLLVVFLAGAGAGYVGGHKYAEYKHQKEFMSRAFESRTGAAEHAASAARSLRSKSLERGARIRRAESAKSARRRSRGERRFMSRLEKDLNLNPAQREDVDRALERHYARIREIRSQMWPQISSIMQEIRRDVRSFLDDDQKISFDKLVEKYEKKREERRKRREERRRKREERSKRRQ